MTDKTNLTPDPQPEKDAETLSLTHSTNSQA